MDVLRLRGVGKRYRSAGVVLTGIDLDVVPGEIVSVTGANGSGKSTLLRVVLGLSLPDTGTVTGRPARVGHVPERFPTRHRMSARDYLRHMGRIRGLDKRTAAVRAQELLEQLALVGGARTPLRLLSKGNAQKVAVAQALLVPPELLVLDEPSAGLDAAAHGTLARLVGEVAATGGAVLFTDHRGSGIAANATTRYDLDAGRLRPAPGPAFGEHVAFVEVAAAGHAKRETADWYALPGVLDARLDGDTVRLSVAGSRCDAVLARVLSEGWSVRALYRTGTGAAPGTPGTGAAGAATVPAAAPTLAARTVAGPSVGDR